MASGEIIYCNTRRGNTIQSQSQLHRFSPLHGYIVQYGLICSTLYRASSRLFQTLPHSAFNPKWPVLFFSSRVISYHLSWRKGRRMLHIRMEISHTHTRKSDEISMWHLYLPPDLPDQVVLSHTSRSQWWADLLQVLHPTAEPATSNNWLKPNTMVHWPLCWW